MFTKFYLTAALGATFVYAHGTMTVITGANGVTGAGFGILASTPRDGSTPTPFEQDTSVIRDKSIASGKTGVCGSTKAGGNNDVASQLAAASDAGLPTADSSGTISMTIHQVNQDGAGPYSCDVSGDGGNTFVAATMGQNVPGFAGLSLATAKDFPITATVPAGTTCSGGPNGDACIVRCRNQALAGPFGSCAAFTMDNAAAGAAGGATAAKGANAAAAAPAAAAAAAPAAAAPAAAAKGGAGGAGGLGALLGGLGGGAAGGAGGAGGLGGLLGGLGGKNRKRVLNSRVAGAKAGYWI